MSDIFDPATLKDGECILFKIPTTLKPILERARLFIEDKPEEIEGIDPEFQDNPENIQQPNNIHNALEQIGSISMCPNKRSFQFHLIDKYEHDPKEDDELALLEASRKI